MGRSRSTRRTASGNTFNLFPAETSLGWRVIGQASASQAAEKMARGEWCEVYDEHENFLGYQVLANYKKDEELASRTTSTSITVRECLLNAAGLKASRTARMTEDQRISRKDRYGKRLPPEDDAERAVEKVAEFGRHRIVASQIVADLPERNCWDAFPELASVEV